jgi:undecaprenyl-diphosphatase
VWAGTIAFAVGIFAALTHQVVAGGSAADRTILVWTAGLRSPRITTFMVGLTALGSPKALAVMMIVVLGVLIALRDRWRAFHLTVAGVGTWMLQTVTKDLVERPRPIEVSHLVSVSGYSYPSGHALAGAALYVTLAIAATRHLRARAAKGLAIGGAVLLVMLVGISRVYLGVHYPSDVVSGIALGTAWAMIVSAAVEAAIADRAR